MNKIQEEHAHLMFRSDIIPVPKDHEDLTIKHMEALLEFADKNTSIMQCYDADTNKTSIKLFLGDVEITTKKQLIQEYIKTL